MPFKFSDFDGAVDKRHPQLLSLLENALLAALLATKVDYVTSIISYGTYNHMLIGVKKSVLKT